MGVKSTAVISRTLAEDLFVDMWLENKRRKARAKAVALSNKELEDVLEIMNDAANDGEGFTNYLIREGKDDAQEQAEENRLREL